MIMSSARPFSSMKHTRHMRPRDCVYCYAEFGGVVLNRLDCVNCDIADVHIGLSASRRLWSNELVSTWWRAAHERRVAQMHSAVGMKPCVVVICEVSQQRHTTCQTTWEHVARKYVYGKLTWRPQSMWLQLGNLRLEDKKTFLKKGDYWNSLSFNQLVEWQKIHGDHLLIRNTKHYLFPTYQNVSVVHQRELSIF